MATLEQLEQGLKAAYAAGKTDYARILAAQIIEARKSPANLIPDAVVPGTVQQKPEPGLGEKIVGVGETALALGTGATGGALGMIGGAAKGLAQSILDGTYGTKEAADLVEQQAMQGAAALTRAPRTQAGQEMTAEVGKALSFLPPIIPAVGPAGAVTQGARLASPAVEAGIQRAAAPVQQVARQAATAAQEMIGKTPSSTGATARGVSVGAAATPQELQRVAVAETMPVPFTGEAALTKGQKTRDFTQLQFEKEAAKRADIGEPLRQRVERQSAVMSQNFGALIDTINPMTTEFRDIGKSVDAALKNRMQLANKQISAAYKNAREAGQMAAPVELGQLAGVVPDIDRFAGLAPNVKPIIAEAKRLGALADDGQGGITAGTSTLENTELLRQFVNDATDWTDPRQRMIAGKVNSAIDSATEGVGGDLYQKARKLKMFHMREFDNVGITKRLTSTKRGTDERQIAYEDVFNKIILDSPLEEMNKVRGTLLKSGPDGKQAWADLKAKGIDYIKTQGTSRSATDSAGNPLILPDKMTGAVNILDKEGKLQTLYGKKQAQTIRDLAELSRWIYTAPPGAINTSNTASALQVALDSLGTFAVTGIPAPAATVLKESVKYVKDKKLRARIADALSTNSK